jgi:hypothetical protein
MIQCVSDWNPSDDEPDFVEEAEKWLKQNQFLENIDSEIPHIRWLHDIYWITKGLLTIIKEEL